MDHKELAIHKAIHKLKLSMIKDVAIIIACVVAVLWMGKII